MGKESHKYPEWSFCRRDESCRGCWFKTWIGQFSGPLEGSKEPSACPGLPSITSPKVLSWSTPPGSERVISKSTCTSSQDFAIAQHADCNVRCYTVNKVSNNDSMMENLMNITVC